MPRWATCGRGETAGYGRVVGSSRGVRGPGGGSDCPPDQLLMRDSDQARERGEPVEASPQQDAAHERYDSAERRTALAASLEGVADQETIEGARVIADTHRGRVWAVGAR